MAICEKQFGKGHANTAKVLIGFAESQQKRGNHAKAKLLAERALAIQEKALPLGHLDLADRAVARALTDMFANDELTAISIDGGLRVVAFGESCALVLAHDAGVGIG